MNAALDMLAAEYVLGTLDPDERRDAEQRLGSDAAFRRAVQEWERILTPLALSAPSLQPGPHVWSAIEARLGPATHSAVSPAPASNVVLLQRSRARWRVATFTTGALAAALALFVLNRDVLRPAPSGQTFVAAVNRGGDMPALIVRVDLASHAVTVRPVEAETPPGKSLELWYIAAGQKPKSMGVIERDRRERMPMPSDMPTKDTMFAVTVEPAGGSPSGAPTGPIVYKGMLIPE